MGHECVERDTKAFTAARDAECVERNDEERRCVAFQAAHHDGQNREDQTADDFKGRCDGYVGKEEGFHSIDAVVIVSVKHVSLDGVDGNIIEHYAASGGVTCIEKGMSIDLLPTKYRGAISTINPMRF